MKRLVLLFPVLAIALHVCMAAPTGAQTVKSLIAQRGYGWDEEEEEKPKSIQEKGRQKLSDFLFQYVRKF